LCFKKRFSTSLALRATCYPPHHELEYIGFLHFDRFILLEKPKFQINFTPPWWTNEPKNSNKLFLFFHFSIKKRKYKKNIIIDHLRWWLACGFSFFEVFINLIWRHDDDELFFVWPSMNSENITYKYCNFFFLFQKTIQPIFH
jgi:hypothetical protein